MISMAIALLTLRVHGHSCKNIPMCRLYNGILISAIFVLEGMYHTNTMILVPQ